jgi:ATP-dependent helicase HepA
MTVFHEGLSLVQRDRNAAWFAEEDGARILICSEIGSEGRNFQFAHHLVLFDLPLDPELLEQRIGRLDRIGQTSEIQVHVPYITGSSHEVLACWYHQGLNSFEKNLAGGRELLDRFGARVHDLAQDFHETEATSRAQLAN